jgi:hypothetical protein
MPSLVVITSVSRLFTTSFRRVLCSRIARTTSRSLYDAELCCELTKEELPAAHHIAAPPLTASYLMLLLLPLVNFSSPLPLPSVRASVLQKYKSEVSPQFLRFLRDQPFHARRTIALPSGHQMTPEKAQRLEESKILVTEQG